MESLRAIIIGFRVCKGDRYTAVRLRRGGENGKLQCVVRCAQIAARNARYMVERVVVYDSRIFAQSLALIGKRFYDCPPNIIERKPFELKNPAS